ncbi:SPOR domain-containing protein [Gemmobacter denitrificans]|uniref:SPOR domain-containing protein n=1 Tax=Gemmobacter denitrificans TaxID=3123040 RepID=A0ABU8BWC1_9RHOB
MFRRLVTAAVFAAVAGTTVAQAQTVSQIGGPAELPPPSFKGQMYVDSRGCVFLKAGLNGRANWVPRVNRDRKVLCGYPPTLQAMAKPIPVAPATVPEPAPVVVAAAPVAPRAKGAPMDTVASLTTQPRIKVAPPPRIDPYLAKSQPAPVASAPRQAQVVVPGTVAPAAGAVTVRQARATGGKIGCYASAPVPQLVALSNGGTAVLCTKGDGSLNGAKAPIYDKVAMGEGRRVGAGQYEPDGTRVSRGAMTVDDLGSPHRATVIARQGSAVAVAEPERTVVPEGFKLAWTDDRLNPYRGMGTASGQAAQDQIWTREVPARLVAEQPQGKRRVIVVSSKDQKKPQLQVSTKADPQAAPRAAKPQAGTGRFYVQVGTFGQPSNADGARARLHAAGLPTGTAKVTKGGKALQIVMAGPFADAGSAQAALRAARATGFGDAFIR